MVAEEVAMKLKEIKELIELVNEKGFAEFEIERQGFRLRISRFKEPHTLIMQPATASLVPASTPPPLELAAPATAPAHTVVSTSAAAHAAPPEVELHTIKSPIVGTFYRAASPTSEPFVKLGDRVEPDTVVCIIEAMKLMNEIQAETTGEIVKIYVESGQAVEYGQPLFAVNA